MDSFVTANRYYINATINDHQVIKSQVPFQDYVVYKIELETIHRRWTIEKRFKEFEKLYHDLDSQKLNLKNVKFPEKRFLKSSKEVIESRKELLSAYLNNLFKFPLILHLKLIHEFLNIDDFLYHRLITEYERCLNYPFDLKEKRRRRSNSYYEKSHTISTNASNEENENEISEYFHKGNKYYSIDILLNKLELEFENTCENIEIFWNWYSNKDCHRKLSQRDISRLLYGYESRKKNSGLLYHSGKINENVFGAESCLNLLCCLVEYETNNECESFINCLKNSKESFIHAMNLYEHLHSSRTQVKGCAYKILKILINNDVEIPLEKILKNDQKLIRNFHEYMKDFS